MRSADPWHYASHRAACTALAVGLVAAIAVPAAAAGDWWLGRSASFEVWSGVSERETRDIVDQLELFRAVVLHQTGLEKLESNVPTTLVIFDKARDYAPVRPRPGVAGFFQAAPHRNFLVVDGSRRLEAIQIAQHEFGHFVLTSATNLSAPPWYHEGFAELLSTIHRDGGTIVVGRAPPERVRQLLAGNSIPLARVLGGTDVLRWSSHALNAFYAQSWLLTHYLHWGREVGFPDRSKQMVAYLEAVGGGADVEPACAQAFGITIEQLEQELLGYLAKGQIPYAKLRATAGVVPEGVSLERLRGADRDARLADLALALGRDASDSAEKWAESALRREPDHPLALVIRAGLAVQREESDPERWLARVRALGSADSDVKRRLADALVLRGSAAPGALDEAEALYGEALRDAPYRPVALVGLARLARERGDLGRAIERLDAARQLLPAFDALDFELAQLYVAANRMAEARASLRRALARSHESAAIAVDLSGLEDLLERAGFPDEGALATRHLLARLEVDAPALAPEAVRIPLSEVRGRAGLWESAFHDVVLAIDESGSTLAASGSDLDGDGRIGHTNRRTETSSDSDDSVFAAEMLAAGRLIEQFDDASVRVGLVGFWHERVLHAPLGPPSALRELLRSGRVRPPEMGATSLALGLAGALDALVAARDPQVRRQRTIVLLSDGVPTVPSPKLGEQQALELADQLADYGIRVYTFALGAEALAGTDAFREIAARTGGKFVPVANPADVVSFLRDVSLTGLDAVEVRNLTTQRPGRALRTFPDGSFDALVELAPGENQIEVTAHVDGRDPLVVRRAVAYAPAAPGDAVAQAELVKLAEVLRLRTAETELARRAREGREAAKADEKERRSLELRVGGDGAASAPESASGSE